MKITYYGHSCFLIEIKGQNLLFDPFITNNPLAKKIDISNIRADYILISHGHEDHIADVPLIMKNNPNAAIVSSFEIINYYVKNYNYNKYHYLGIGGTLKLDSFSVELTPALHSSSFPDGSYAGLAAGFIIENDVNKIYYAGDTSVFSDMQHIIDVRPIDLAILPIGGTFTMCSKKALQSSHILKVNKIIGVHYNTFPLIEIDTEEAIELFNDAGKQLLLPKIGSTISI